MGCLIGQATGAGCRRQLHRRGHQTRSGISAGHHKGALAAAYTMLTSFHRRTAQARAVAPSTGSGAATGSSTLRGTAPGSCCAVSSVKRRI